MIKIILLFEQSRELAIRKLLDSLTLIRRISIILFFLAIYLFITNDITFAQEEVANNKFGVHILFTDEISEAAALVNSNGGDWGYVTIPIQSGDRNLEKWQKFMDESKKFHLIPIIRLATEGDYFNTKVWRKPTYDDVLDFANFLNSLYWPTKNRYVIVFNEVNRGDEWGGFPNPHEYADILSYAITIFKSKNQDFFILSSGFDNASITVPNLSMNEYEFMEKMNEQVPGIFYQIDGVSSHSYPNPAFAKPPSQRDRKSIASFIFEKQFMQKLGSQDLPVFITETGWSQDKIPDSQVSEYYKIAFSDVWNSQDVLAVTPFLLRANTKPFSVFSLLRPDGSRTSQYETLEKMEKVKGSPLLAKEIKKEVVPGEKTEQPADISVKTFSQNSSSPALVIPQNSLLKTVIKWFFKI